MNIVLVTGGFDPLHSGHIEYFKAAKKLGDRLVVGLNSDEWLTRKKGRPFMPYSERAAIIKELKDVDEVIDFDDSDDTANNAIGIARTKTTGDVIFANGGDRTDKNIPEIQMWNKTQGVQFVFGVGGIQKKNSSSSILKDWNQPTTERVWGKYTVLDKGKGWQVKQLEFDAGKALSDQRHFKRSEHWHVVEGNIEMILQYAGKEKCTHIVGQGHSIDIPALVWHKAVNNDKRSAKIIEVWLGNDLTEDDIERRD